MFKPPLVQRHVDGPHGLRMLFPSFIRVPLACGSFLFFHAMKQLLSRLHRVRTRNQESLAWHTISEVLDRPLALPYVMVTAPRWNPHALIARIGPFQVEHSLRMQTDTAHRSARMWTLVISRASDTHTVAAIDSNSASRDDAWHEQILPPGRYSVALRYYELAVAPRLPALEIDGGRRIPERSVSPTENDYLGRLRNKDGVYYACLHYYMLTMLCLRRYLPESWVRREYLPVGNPKTAFLYGHLRRGQSIAITSSNGIPQGHRLYLTLYNRSSFPVLWCEVTSLPYRTPSAEAAGSYLLRLHPLCLPQRPPLWPDHLRVDVQ
jgi:Family of unknown function (DUF6208)